MNKNSIKSRFSNVRVAGYAIWSAFVELIWISVPVIIWLFWLTVTREFSEFINKPEISFISVILSAEALRTNLEFANKNSKREMSYFLLLVVLIVICTVFIGLDIGQYQKQIIDENSVNGILTAKPYVLVSSALGFVTAKYFHALRQNERQPQTEGKTRTYTPEMSSFFYSAISREYDRRNSPALRQVHLEIVTILRSLKNIRSGEFNVLDLGGGTGRLIAEHFYGDPSVKWVLVDSSQEMLNRSKEYFAGAAMSIDFVLCSIIDGAELDELIGQRKFDAIIMSYALSSLRENPAWPGIVKYLNGNGTLVIGEHDSNYVFSNPTFDIEVGITLHQLNLRPQNVLSLISEIEACGLAIDVRGLTKRDRESNAEINYSYIMRCTRGRH